MKKYYILDDLKINISMNEVLRMLDCHEDSPVYEDFVEDYQSIYPGAMEVLQPVGILGFGTVPEHLSVPDIQAGAQVVYCVLSVGAAISDRSTKAFQEGQYVKGMLYNTIADAALFSLEDQMQEHLKKICAECGVGVIKRLEAPQDIPMEIHQEAWKQLELEKNLGIGITDSYMLDPVKTSCQVFVLTEDAGVFRAQHDCSSCTNTGCKMRGWKARKMHIVEKDSVKEVQYEEGETLLDALVRCGIFLSAPCGGAGRCGKCRVKILEGQAPVTQKDSGVFSRDELDSGWRLACLLHPSENMTVSVGEQQEKDFEIVGEYAAISADSKAENTTASADESGQYSERNSDSFAVAVDLGTTTLVFQLLKKDTGEIIHTAARLNQQRKYGVDVISRILASVSGKKEELKCCIQTDLKNGMQKLLQESGISEKEIGSVVLGGNTTMIHLLMGYECSKLGVYPFEPVNVDFIRGTWGKLVENENEAVDNGNTDSDNTAIESAGRQNAGCQNAELTILPGISAFVGGDITAGIYSSDMDCSEEICLLVDLGTNGEMALGNQEKILTTSTAAGPAFEGGNISCGTGSVAGAVCSVTLEEDETIIKTIRDQAPVGICGTGVVELVAELLRTGKMDETGLMDEIYEAQGFPVARDWEGKDIFFTQKDVRELQLAKAAIRAGIEVLLKRYGIAPAQVEKVYLAGGFGYKLDIHKAIAIGMFPKEFCQKVQAVGNSCMAGAVKFLGDQGAEERMRRLVQISEEVNLAMDADFQEHYMEAMMFE